MERANAVHNLIDKLELSKGVVVGSTSSTKLSPRSTVALLRDILRLHDATFDELTISDLAQLQCAATANGHYVWAHRREIMELGDKLTPCDLDERRRSTDRLKHMPPDNVCGATSPSLNIRLKILSVEALAAWDWRKTYCEWRLLHSNSAAPLACGVTSQHLDPSCAPSWSATEFPIDSVSSVEMLRECRLVVRVKRPSRCLGILKWVENLLKKWAYRGSS